MAMERLKEAAITPLDYMLSVLMDPKSDKKDRQWAAEKAAPYVHRKMPIAIEGGDPAKPLIVATAQQLRNLSAEELALLQKLSPKLEYAAPIPEQIMRGIAEKIINAEEAEESE